MRRYSRDKDSYWYILKGGDKYWVFRRASEDWRIIEYKTGNSVRVQSLDLAEKWLKRKEQDAKAVGDDTGNASQD